MTTPAWLRTIPCGCLVLLLVPLGCGTGGSGGMGDGGSPTNCNCPSVSDPVCGSDRVSYDSACKAECAGTKIETAGSCGAGGADGGVRTCTQVSDPVCGADGRDYLNACLASSAGVKIAHAGACATSGQCGGTTCGAGQACCGPPACGRCIPETSGQYCPDQCPVADSGLGCSSTPGSPCCDPYPGDGKNYCSLRSLECCGNNICQPVGSCPP